MPAWCYCLFWSILTLRSLGLTKIVTIQPSAVTPTMNHRPTGTLFTLASEKCPTKLMTTIESTYKHTTLSCFRVIASMPLFY